MADSALVHSKYDTKTCKDGRELKGMDKYGGWERIMSPRFELSEEIILELKALASAENCF